MVVNKNSMGYEMNKNCRKKLIYIYEEYIKDSRDEFIKKGAWDFVIGDTFFYTESVEKAINCAHEIFSGNLSVNKAKKILKELKKEDEEDK